MSDLLSIGASGVRAYQTALGTVSDNIANAGTAGYARRTASVREVAATGSFATAPTGMGVAVLGVTRSGDLALSSEVRLASSDLAKSETAATWMERIETALGGTQIGERLTAFFTAAKGVAADATALPARASMLEAASAAASAFAATDRGLADAATDLDGTAQAAVAQLNGLATALAKVNAGLGRTASGSAGAAALLDQRDQLLEQMSALSDVSVTFDAAGRAGVRVGGATGPELVTGEAAGTIGYARSDGATAFTVTGFGEAKSLTPAGGALAGIAEGAQRIAAARGELATLARDFAEGANAVQAAGEDLDGKAGAPLFAIGEPAAQLSVALTDGRGIAAAAVGGGTRDNRNLAGFDTLRTTGKVEAGVSDLTATNAAALAARNTVAGAQTTIRDAAVGARDAATGVNIDEEAVDLMRFQQAYQASSRVIQVARETLQSILELR